MSMPASSFLEFNLPDPATWFYFSLLLAVALFFKFTRVLSVRNLDVLTLFLLVPGLLLLQEAHTLSAVPACCMLRKLAPALPPLGYSGSATCGFCAGPATFCCDVWPIWL